MKNKHNYLLRTSFCCFFIIQLIGCSGGGSSKAPTIISQEATQQETDQRIPFEAFTNEMVSPWGDVTATYSTSVYFASSYWPSNDKYKIVDYGFLEVTTEGTHPGDSYNPDEISYAGPYSNNAQWFEANLNNDEHVDLIYVGNNCCNRNYVLEDLMFTFINDGNGHYALSPEMFNDGIFPCVQGGRSWLSDEIDTMHPCGNQQDYTNGKIVADFNGDGISDYYDTSILFLSDGEGKLENLSHTNLPDLFFNDAHGQIFVHDAHYGDLDGDGDLDIFVPIVDSTVTGFKFGGAVDECSGCTQPIPFTALINDGSGFFAANHNIPQFTEWVEVDYDNWGNNIDNIWPTTAAIGDFDNDGHGDIALGWFNPIIADRYGFSKNSAGVVYFNNGNNDWTQRESIELPTNFFEANGNANDMEVFDFNNDGYLDIVLASTIHEPYYNSRVIQFFQNEQGKNFIDVTAAISPDHTKYADGNPYSSWWVGQGKMHIRDYDHDGDLDIIDVSTRTSVFVNNGNTFELYDDFVDADEDVLLWPVEIDGDHHYDFIGSNQTCAETTCTTSFYQLLDPPAESLLADFLTKADGFLQAVTQSTYLTDHLKHSNVFTNVFSYTNNKASILGYSAGSNNLSFTSGKVSGLMAGSFIGFSMQPRYLKIGLIATDISTIANNETRWFGNNRAELRSKNYETYFEAPLITTNNVQFALGHAFSHVKVDQFAEQGSQINLTFRANEFNFNSSYIRFGYEYSFLNFRGSINGGFRESNKSNLLMIDTVDNLTFYPSNKIKNQYLSMMLTRDIFYFQIVKDTFGEKFATGFQINL